MKPGPKLAAYLVALGAMVGVGATVGSAVGPIDVGGSGHETVEHSPTSTTEPGGAVDHGHRDD